MGCNVISSGDIPAFSAYRVVLEPLHPFVFLKSGLCSRRHHGAFSKDLSGKSILDCWILDSFDDDLVSGGRVRLHGIDPLWI